MWALKVTQYYFKNKNAMDLSTDDTSYISWLPNEILAQIDGELKQEFKEHVHHMNAVLTELLWMTRYISWQLDSNIIFNNNPKPWESGKIHHFIEENYWISYQEGWIIQLPSTPACHCSRCC